MTVIKGFLKMAECKEAYDSGDYKEYVDLNNGYVAAVHNEGCGASIFAGVPEGETAQSVDSYINGLQEHIEAAVGQLVHGASTLNDWAHMQQFGAEVDLARPSFYDIETIEQSMKTLLETAQERGETELYNETANALNALEEVKQTDPNYAVLNDIDRGLQDIDMPKAEINKIFESAQDWVNDDPSNTLQQTYDPMQPQ